MARRDAVVTDVRLVPRWFAGLVLLLFGGMFAFLGIIACFADGWMRLQMGTGAVISGLMLIAAVTTLALPRRRADLAPDADGITTIESPLISAASLMVAWAALLVWAVLHGYRLLTDFGSVTAPGVTTVAVLGALASLPDAWRLLTGRLHRWRVVLTPTTVTYRGYRTDITIAWPKVRGATIQRRKPAGVKIDVKGTGDDVVVPYVAFRLPAEQLVDLIEEYRASAPR